MEWDVDIRVFNERNVRLRDIVKRHGPRFMYEYDFGDGWEHALEVVKLGPPDTGKWYPVCLAGERACPPEDVGGVWGYGEFLEAIGNPKHEDHGAFLEWVDGEFDPDAFDIDEVNWMLREIR